MKSFALAMFFVIIAVCVCIGADDEVQSEITVFACASDASTQPQISLSPLFKGSLVPAIRPRWRGGDGVWIASLNIPPGHYIVEARSEHCASSSRQWIAAPGQIRHVSLTLDRAAGVVSIDENMYANAIFGILPSPNSAVEVMSADDPIGEQTRRAANVDGNFYQIGYLRPGNYVVRITFGAIIVSKTVTIPPNKYAATVEAGLPPAVGVALLQKVESGSRFVDHHWSGGGGAIQSYERGTATVNGWTTVLSPPADYYSFELRLSRRIVNSLERADQYLKSDATLTSDFRALGAWRAILSHRYDDAMVVRLEAPDGAPWQKTKTTIGSFCDLPNERHSLELVIDRAGKVTKAEECP